MTGFEPATTRPPDVDSTELNYIPNGNSAKIKQKSQINSVFLQEKRLFCSTGFQADTLAKLLWVINPYYL